MLSLLEPFRMFAWKRSIKVVDCEICQAPWRGNYLNITTSKNIMFVLNYLCCHLVELLQNAAWLKKKINISVDNSLLLLLPVWLFLAKYTQEISLFSLGFKEKSPLTVISLKLIPKHLYSPLEKLKQPPYYAMFNLNFL